MRKLVRCRGRGTKNGDKKLKVGRKFWFFGKCSYICTPDELDGPSRTLAGSGRKREEGWVSLCETGSRETGIGLMAEWLGKGLQNLIQRFESASDLTETAL